MSRPHTDYAKQLRGMGGRDPWTKEKATALCRPCRIVAPAGGPTASLLVPGNAPAIVATAAPASPGIGLCVALLALAWALAPVGKRNIS